jgi:hypothetical protein
MKSLRDLESVGWGFFLGCAAALAGPFIWLTLAMTYDTIPLYGRVIIGIMFSFVAAAFVAWIVNDLLHRRNLRRKMAARSRERKAKKKRK